MELAEIFFAPFTTPSTCFSCSPCSHLNRRLPFRFATENHVLGLSYNSNANPKTKKPYGIATHGTIPHDKPSVICVGFAQSPSSSTTHQHNHNSDNGPIQALALIDPLCIDQPEDALPPLRQPPPALDSTARGDDASVVSTSHSIQDGGGSTIASSRASSSVGGGGSRRPSFSNNSTSALSTTSATAAATTTTTATSLTRSKSSDGSGMLDQSFRSLPNSGSGESSADAVPTLEEITTSLQPPKARLLLQVPPRYDSSRTMTAMGQDYVALLDFRPLSPCIAQWGVGDDDDDDDCSAMARPNLGIFVGSADDSQLRFFEATNNSLDRRLVARTDLPEEHFSIDAPIMGIDFHSDGTTHTLATVGQDGTIQMISWKGNDRTFQDISSHRVIVDGPLVSLQLQELADGGLRIVIGSLCGYVCHLTRAAAGSASEWQGPTMVIQGLWNDRLRDEDSVLAVHAFGDCVALGTLGGRCLIYQAALFGPQYYKLWECTLPYSIHGLEVRPTRTTTGDDEDSIKDDENSFDLLILTRRSVHVFRPKMVVPISLPRTNYSIQGAKDRLQSLLQQHEAENSVENKPTLVDDDKEDGDEDEVPSGTEAKLGDGTTDDVARLGTECTDALPPAIAKAPTLDDLGERDQSNEEINEDQSPLYQLESQPEEPIGHATQETTASTIEEVSSTANNSTKVDDPDDDQWILIDTKEETTDAGIDELSTI